MKLGANNFTEEGVVTTTLAQQPDLDWDDLELELLQYEDLELDCDGVSDMIALHLQDKGLIYRYMSGSVEERHTGRLVSPHCWIEIEGRVVDLRLRHWLGDRDSVPHGIFDPLESNCRYGGYESQHRPVNWLAICDSTDAADSPWPFSDEELDEAVFPNAEAVAV